MIDKIIILLFKIRCKMVLKKYNEICYIKIYYRNLKAAFHSIMFDIEQDHLIKKF